MKQLTHDTHPGITRMKSLYVWWPGISIDKDIVSTVPKCQICQESHPSAPLHPWNGRQYPGAVYTLVQLFLIIIDAHSKWIYALIVNSNISGSYPLEKALSDFQRRSVYSGFTSALNVHKECHHASKISTSLSSSMLKWFSSQELADQFTESRARIRS